MKETTDQERQAIWETLLLRSVNGVLRHGELQRTATFFRVGRHVVERIWKRGISTMGACVAAVVKSRKSACGRKKLDRTALCERIAEVPANERENQRTIQLASNLSCYIVQQLIKEGYIRRALRQTRPILTPIHKLTRLKFCVDHVKPCRDGGYEFDAMFDVVHIDEKWFEIKKVGKKVYILTGKADVPLEAPPVQLVQSKRHIKKVMFLCAVARPRGDWDGKVGLWPVVERYITQRSSVNRPAGVEELRPVTITREISREMLINDVIPAIKAKWPHDRKSFPIRIQQDNARPHVLEDDPYVNEAGCSDGWNITLRNQPAQSPDLNCLDLGFFASIQSLQSKTRPVTNVDLIKEVELAFQETTAETLNKTLLTLQHVMEHIMNCKGGNEYSLGHLHKDKLLHAGSLPTSLPCDAISLAIANESMVAFAANGLTAPHETTTDAARSRTDASSLSPGCYDAFDPFFYL